MILIRFSLICLLFWMISHKVNVCLNPAPFVCPAPSSTADYFLPKVTRGKETNLDFMTKRKSILKQTNISKWLTFLIKEKDEIKPLLPPPPPSNSTDKFDAPMKTEAKQNSVKVHCFYLVHVRPFPVNKVPHSGRFSLKRFTSVKERKSEVNFKWIQLRKGNPPNPLPIPLPPPHPFYPFGHVTLLTRRRNRQTGSNQPAGNGKTGSWRESAAEAVSDRHFVGFFFWNKN